MTGGKRLSGKHVVITAGGSGIGRAIAERFHSEGARIAVCDIDDSRVEALKTEHPDWLCSYIDVADETQATAFMRQVAREFGHLDCLVNNAGIAGPTAPIEEIATEDWQRVIGINLLGGVFCTRLASPLFREAGGSVLFLSSIAGRIGVPYRTPYAATKWAVVGMAKSLAIELGDRRIRVNAILPGLTSGPRLDGVVRTRAEKFGRSFEEQMALECGSTALGEPCSADDIAAAALFLASEDGIRITGVALSVDAGMETVPFR